MYIILYVCSSMFGCILYYMYVVVCLGVYYMYVVVCLGVYYIICM